MKSVHDPRGLDLSRRQILSFAAGTIMAGASARALFGQPEGKPGAPKEHPVTLSKPSKELFPISLAEWSLHRELQGDKLTNLDFPAAAKERFGISAVEYVNVFFKGTDSVYLKELGKRCSDHGVRSVLIMCDGEGALGDAEEKKRLQAVANHHKWVEAAKVLGCHSIRVNAQSSGGYEEQQKLAADGLRRLTEFADTHAINVIVENHGGLSSNGRWLAGTIARVKHQRCGTLPDFGNFRISDKETYDRYEGVKELMPTAKGASAKSYDFDDKGEETTIDYRRMLRIVLDSGYRGHIGVEYEGSKLSEPEGIFATKKLLEKLRAELTSEYGHQAPSEP